MINRAFAAGVMTASLMAGSCAEPNPFTQEECAAIADSLVFESELAGEVGHAEDAYALALDAATIQDNHGEGCLSAAELEQIDPILTHPKQATIALGTLATLPENPDATEIADATETIRNIEPEWVRDFYLDRLAKIIFSTIK